MGGFRLVFGMGSWCFGCNCELVLRCFVVFLWVVFVWWFVVGYFVCCGLWVGRLWCLGLSAVCSLLMFVGWLVFAIWFVW